tara:strand:+ start:338 stop:454 length:117 start_codon:yes stop_codon:yes gene_type:complete
MRTKEKMRKRNSNNFNSQNTERKANQIARRKARKNNNK